MQFKANILKECVQFGTPHTFNTAVQNWSTAFIQKGDRQHSSLLGSVWPVLAEEINQRQRAPFLQTHSEVESCLLDALGQEEKSAN